MKNLTQKLFTVLLLLAMVFSFLPMDSQALTYSEIQSGKVLGDNTMYPYPSGSLVNDGGTIYFISGTTKVPFTNWQAFVGLGYSLRNVVNGNLQNYTPAQTYFITTANAPHPWGSWLLYNRTIYYSHETGLIGVPTWDVFLQNGGKSAYIVKANNYDVNILNTNSNISILTTNDQRVYNQPSSIAQTPIQNQPIVTPTPTNSSPTTPVNYLQKQTLVFSIDQTWLNGIVNVRDTVSLQRIINTLKQFQNKYEVYALLNPSNADQTKVFAVLDVLAANGIPFVLDQYSSDSHKDTVNSPYDPYHGLALSLDQLKTYKQKYGSSFAGIRFMEVFGANFTVLACKLQGVDWCKYFNDQLPTDNFYQKSIAETYVKFASDNKMFVLWSDFYWSFLNNWEFDQNTVKQPQNEQEMKDLMAKYPGVIVAVFDNNLPEDGARKNNLIDTWFNNFKPYIQNGAKGFGLSDQNWMCNKDTSGCPAQEMANWATKAFANGATVVQFEPVWYFWNLPEGTIDQWVVAGQNPTGYTQDSAWSNRGYVRNNLVVVGNALGVSVSTEQLVQQNSSVCLSVNVPDTLNIGQSFTGTITVQNSGNTTWTQVSSSNPNPYRLGANDFAQPPYSSSIWGRGTFLQGVAV